MHETLYENVTVSLYQRWRSQRSIERGRRKIVSQCNSGKITEDAVELDFLLE